MADAPRGPIRIAVLRRGTCHQRCPCGYEFTSTIEFPAEMAASIRGEMACPRCGQGFAFGPFPAQLPKEAGREP